MKDFRIYIPTYQRLGHQTTIQTLPRSILEKVWLVCRPEEAEQLSFLWHSQILVYDGKEDIGLKRQWILEQCPTEICYMMDDDMRFRRRVDRNNMENTSVIKSEPEYLHNAILEIVELCSPDVPMVGISPSFGQQNHRCEFEFNKRLFGNFALHKPTILSLPQKFSSLPLMEDFYVTLGILTSGRQNAMACHIIWDQARGSGANGGCTTFRTLEAQTEAAKRLVQEFPQFVKLRDKQTKGMGKTVDCTIQWKKAYQYGLTKRKASELL